MRTIKFRGKSIEDNKWVFGHYYVEYGSMPYPIKTPKSPPQAADTHWIVFPSFADWGMPRQMQRVQVDAETIGQFIGFRGKDDREIYEGNIVEYEGNLYEVGYEDGQFFLVDYNWEYAGGGFVEIEWENCKIMGDK